eukprot:scaffold436_cov267-Pinguiococcus_pyrenoidosus.AAC.13
MKLERGQQMVVAPRNVIAWQVPARADGIPPKHLRSGTVMFQGPLELFLQGNPAKEQRLLLAGSSPEGGAKSKSVLSKSRIGAKGKLAIFTVVLGVVAYDVYKHKWDTPNIYKRRWSVEDVVRCRAPPKRFAILTAFVSFLYLCASFQVHLADEKSNRAVVSPHTWGTCIVWTTVSEFRDGCLHVLGPR